MRTIAFLTAVLLCACGPSLQSEGQAADPILRVEPGTPSAGDTVTLVLDNRSPHSVGYNLCTSVLERSSGAGRQAVPSDRVCTMELRTLEPGQRARYSMEVPEGLAPGEYVYLANVEVLDTGERRAVRSEPFRVGS